MTKKIGFTLVATTFFLIALPTLSCANDFSTDNIRPSISIHNQTPSKNPLLADAPTIANAPPNITVNSNVSSNENTHDILTTPPREVIGGSAHQNNQINKYLGIAY